MHGLGVATILLAHLAEAAERAGIRTFTATVHPTNHRMANVLRDSGFPVEVTAGPGELSFELPASLDAAAVARFEDRDRVAAVAAVTHVLKPASIAIIGASRRPDTVGAAVLENLIASGYRGALHVVHPVADTVGGVATVRSIAAVPGPVDVAVIAVPAAAVAQVARECGAAGVCALLVLSAGFAEVGAAGVARQVELLEACRASGMRLVGPNCLGVLDTRPGLNATFAPQPSLPGRIAFASQSGAFGILAIAEAARRGLGLSSFVSVGNKADLSGNDFLRYWDEDPGTDVILLYLESFGNPRRFGRIARSIATRTPIVAVKSGRSAAGARAAASHTAALLAASDVTVDALFAHAGVIRTDTVGQQLDVAALLAAQPLPGGDRVAIVAIFIPPLITHADDVAAAIRAVAPAAAAHGTPLLAVFMAATDAERRALAAGGDVPVYGTPEEAAHALGHVTRYGAWRRRGPDEPPVLDAIDAGAAGAVMAGSLARGGGWLEPEEVEAVLAAYGIPLVRSRRAATPAEAGRAADELGGPVAVKAIAAGLLHKSDSGGVVLGVEGERAVAHAASEIAASIRATGHEPEGFLVQRMAPPGAELLVGIVVDPDFGPIVACGAGGRAVEVLGDVAVRLAPLGRRDAAELLRSLRTFPLLNGYRGQPAADLAGIEDVLLRVSVLGAAHPEIAELDCNLLLAGPDGAVVLDARIRVAAPRPSRPFPALDR